MMKIASHLPKASFPIALIGAVLLLGGCLPEPSFPDEPAIEFQSFDLSASGGRELVIGFTDGDGNVGLAQADTLEPFCPTCEYHQNLKCEYQEWRDTAWVEIGLNPDAGQIPFYYRVPPVAPTGQNPAQSGTISIEMNSWFLNSPYDSMRFRITLYDRDLNASNEAYTPATPKP
ncbi:MAG TPA: hypothetical protein DD635_08890 [Flavobacteriales bacterium]|nr:hypothetical protein [Flavobacteriales bacterium]